ncbi:hypothetical protein MNAN1_003783 [Malassezia nana]|uniref:FHA domain-containing protein n=1 Tax=Malassezia nana TaxID=180528 RepID=A0AAF0EPX8_9BASI|nr:hypothetical protein MNAN1_003783 [Malassezia nana]
MLLTTDMFVLWKQSCYLFGRDRTVVDIPTEHPSCSKQHAVIQFRQVTKRNDFGDVHRSVSKIEKNELRLGSLTEIQGHTAMAWRHWGCTTERVLANMRKEIEDVTQKLDGFEDLEAADQEKVLAAFALGHVRDEDKTPALADMAASQENKEQAQPRSRKRKVSEKKERDSTPVDNSDDDEVERPDFLDELPTKRTRKQTQRFGAEDAASHARRVKRKVPESKEEDDKDQEEEGEEGEEEEEEEEDDEDEHDEDEDDSDDSDAFHASDTGDDDDDEDDDD